MLVRNVRKALDRDGFNNVKIIVSCGFDDKKIRYFNEKKVPYDIVGVGSAIFRERTDFTADVNSSIGTSKRFTSKCISVVCINNNSGEII